MSILTEEKSIKSCDDFELNYERPQKLSYKYSYPKSKQIQGIVFLIHGFGATPAYMDNLRLSIAEEYSVIAVDVYYHCFFSRLVNGAKLEFDGIDTHILQDIIDKYQIDFSGVKDINTDSVIKNMDKQVGILKSLGRFNHDFKLKLSATIIPKNNEYQNFGIMQAIDHINVLLELENMPFDFAPNYSVTLMGTSHGGYLAHLIAKLAPHKINSVIDNSCYTTPPAAYILGKETNILNPEFFVGYEHILLNCFVQTLWTSNSKSEYFFTSDHYRIRNLNDSAHINELSKNKIRYVSYHSAEDGIAKIDDKIALYKKFIELGFDAELHIIDNPSQIDGKFIKTLSHGMSMSLKELARKELPKALEIKNNNQKNNTVTYKCDNFTYQFEYKSNNLDVILM